MVNDPFDAPSRPRSHELETESRREFEYILPSAWVTHPVVSDYGIDSVVEIFENGKTTGFEFKVQLKGTDDPEARTRQIKLGSLGYWRSLDVPVLIVFFQAATGELFGRWAHEQIETDVTEGQKTTTVHFDESHKIDRNSWSALSDTTKSVRAWKERLAEIPLTVVVSEERPSDQFIFLQLMAQLQFRSVSVRHLLRFEGGGSDDSEADVEVSISSNDVHVKLRGDVASTRDSWTLDSKSARRSADNVLMYIGLTLARMGWADEAAVICSETGISSDLCGTPSWASEIATVLHLGGQAVESLLIGLQLVTDDRDAVRLCGRIFLYPAMLHRSELAPELLGALAESLSMLAESEALKQNEKDAGIDYFNCALVVRQLGDKDGALKRLELAERHWPEYSRMQHFHAERAGILWDSGKFEAAADSYDTASGLEEKSQHLEILLADAFLWAGKYAQCRERLDQADSSGDVLEPLAILDKEVSRFFVEDLGIPEQTRTALDPPYDEKQLSPSEELFELWMSQDCLAPGMYLLAVDAQGNTPFIAALILAMNKKDRPDLWAQATVACVREGKPPEVLRAVVLQAQFFAPTDYLEALDQVKTHAHEEREELLRAIYEQIVAPPPRPQSLAFNLLGDVD